MILFVYLTTIRYTGRMEAIHTRSDVVSLFNKVDKSIKEDAIDTCRHERLCIK